MSLRGKVERTKPGRYPTSCLSVGGCPADDCSWPEAASDLTAVSGSDACMCCRAIATRPEARTSASLASPTSRRINSATAGMSVMPPAVCPAVSKVASGRPVCVVEMISALRRSRSRRASSRLALQRSRNSVWIERSTVPKPAVPGSGTMSLTTSALMMSSDFAAMIARFHSSDAGDSRHAMKRVPRLTPAAPSIKAAAMPRPSKMPPAATTGIGATASTTCGTSAIVLTSPAYPPASLP